MELARSSMGFHGMPETFLCHKGGPMEFNGTLEVPWISMEVQKFHGTWLHH